MKDHQIYTFTAYISKVDVLQSVHPTLHSVLCLITLQVIIPHVTPATWLASPKPQSRRKTNYGADMKVHYFPSFIMTNAVFTVMVTVRDITYACIQDSAVIITCKRRCQNPYFILLH